MNKVPINQARTIHTAFYTDKNLLDESKEKIFAPSWQLVTNTHELEKDQTVIPLQLMNGFLNEPIVVSKYNNQAHCYSNICTHRGMIVVNEKQTGVRQLTCPYHGRCFRLDGSFKSMPEFANAENFPTVDDDLHPLKIEKWKMFYFTQLTDGIDFNDLIKDMDERLSFIDFDKLIRRPEHDNRFMVDAHWALYVDNYLEGLHIPFVHKGLNDALAMEQYKSELYKLSNLQLGVGASGSEQFDMPKDHPDYGKGVHAYYYWLWPNMMFNFYTWGLSVNIINPISIDKTEVIFQTWLFDHVAEWSDKDLVVTEMEDETVVHSVQQGVRSRFYQSGRYSPTMEQGLYHFHNLIKEKMQYDG